MDRPPPLIPVAIGCILEFHIAPEFMKLAERAMENSMMPPEEYFACIFNRLLCQGLAELERQEADKTLAVVYRFPGHGRRPD